MPEENEENKDPNRMTFLEHLDELRKRILASFLAIFVAFVGCYAVSDILLEVLEAPLKELLPENAALIGTGVAEAFLVRILVAVVGALMLACPFWLYQLWMFISPGLYSREKKQVAPFVFFSTICFLGGVTFGYFVVFPVGFKFFLEQYQDVGVVANIRIREYFSFTSKLLLAFGLCFELPVVAFFLGRLGVISWRSMVKAGKYAVLLIFIVAAMLTPPDVASQTLLAGPLIVLYCLSIGVVALTGKRKPAPPEEKKEPEQSTPDD